MTTDRATLLALADRVEAASGPDACWIWPRKLDAAGRGRYWLDGKPMLAHRAVWTVLRGDIPAGAFLCHHCDNPSCVNPKHIYAGTHADNMRDMVERKRYFAARDRDGAVAAGRKSGLANTWARGAGNPKAKLTQEQVGMIAKDQRPTRFLADEYQVDRTTIQRIRRGALWNGPSGATTAAALRALAQEATSDA